MLSHPKRNEISAMCNYNVACLFARFCDKTNQGENFTWDKSFQQIVLTDMQNWFRVNQIEKTQDSLEFAIEVTIDLAKHLPKYAGFIV